MNFYLTNTVSNRNSLNPINLTGRHPDHPCLRVSRYKSVREPAGRTPGSVLPTVVLCCRMVCT